MAEGTKLRLTFVDTDASTMSLNYNYADSSVSTSDVRVLMNAMIDNNDIFERKPAVIKNAMVITTTETTIPVTD